MTGSGGLSSAQVQASRQQHGCNRLTACNENKLVSRFLSGFSDPIIRILLIALCINLLFMLRGAPWFETVGIAAAVFLATFISALSEYGSDAAFRRMQTEAANVTCRVRRNGGRIVVIPADDVVCGDLILLQAGESIPADGVLREGQVDVNQSALTGENHDLHKTLDAELLRGSDVTSGEGIMEATAVGSKSAARSSGCPRKYHQQAGHSSRSSRCGVRPVFVFDCSGRHAAARSVYPAARPSRHHAGSDRARRRRAGGSADDDNRRVVLQYAAHDARPCFGSPPDRH